MFFLIALGHYFWSLSHIESIHTFSVHLNRRVSKPRSTRFLLCGPRPHLKSFVCYTNLNGYVHPWLWFSHMRTANQLIITVLALLPEKKILYAPVSNNTHLPMSIWYSHQTNTSSFSILIALLSYMCVSMQQIGITSCYGLHSAIQAIEFIDWPFLWSPSATPFFKNRTTGCENKPVGFENRNGLLRLA